MDMSDKSFFMRYCYSISLDHFEKFGRNRTMKTDDQASNKLGSEDQSIPPGGLRYVRG